MGEGGLWVDLGGLAGYGSDAHETGRRAARLVDRILKPARPGDLPVEVNEKIELVINVKLARAQGLQIPPGVLYRADRLVQ
jgi:putative ABC transport system substrate-binding protein